MSIKITLTRKMKSRNNLKIDFSFVVNLNTFERKIKYWNIIEEKISRIEDPSLNWLASESGSHIVLFFRREDPSLNSLEFESGLQKSLQCFACMGSHASKYTSIFFRFSFVSERFSTISTKQSKRPFLRERGLHILI